MWRKFFPGICSFQFRERSRKFFDQHPSVFQSMSESELKRCFFFSTLVSLNCSSGLIEHKFDILAVFPPKISNFSALTPKIMKKHFFIRKRFSSVKRILSARRKQFRWTLQKVSAKSRKKTKQVIGHQEMWWKRIPWTFNMQFKERSQNYLGNVPVFFAQKLKKTKECFFWTSLFSSRCSFGLIAQNFGNTAKFTCRKTELFSL